MNFFITPAFYYTYSAILILLFGIMASRIIKPYFHAQKASDLAIEELKNNVNNKALHARFEEFDKWVGDHSELTYVKTCITPAWQYFKTKHAQSQTKNNEFAPDVYDFFLEDRFIQKFGKRKLVEAVPGMFLALGIFGTFLSIAVGISALDINGNTEDLKEGIGSLLKGMEGKFVSSLVGIFLSISWQFLDRAKGYPILSESFHNLRQQLDLTFPTQDETSVLFKLLQNEESRFNEYRDLVQKVIVPELSTTLSETLENTLVPAIERMETNILEVQKNGVSELITQFTDTLKDTTGDHMKELGETVNKAIEWQELVSREVHLLVKAVQDSSEMQMKITEKNTTISENVVKYADRLEEMVIQFTEVTGKMNLYQVEVGNLLDKLTLERDLFHEFYAKHMTNLQSDIERIQNITKHQVEYQSKLEENLQWMQNLSTSQSSLSQSLTEQAKSAQSMTNEINKTLTMVQTHGSTYTKLQEELKDQFESLSKNRQKQDEVYEDMLTSIKIQSASMDKQVHDLKGIWESTSHTLTDSMGQFVSDMNQSLSTAFKQIDGELAKSVSYLIDSTNAIQSGVSDLSHNIGDFRQSVDEFTKRAVG